MNASAVIAYWPSPKEFAADVSEAVNTVYVWSHRGSIPDAKVTRVLAAAVRRGFPLGLDAMGRLAVVAPHGSAGQLLGASPQAARDASGPVIDIAVGSAPDNPPDGLARPAEDAA